MGQFHLVATDSPFKSTLNLQVAPALEEFESLMVSWFEEFPSLTGVMSEHLENALSEQSGSEELSEQQSELRSSIHNAQQELDLLSSSASQAAEESRQSFAQMHTLCEDLFFSLAATPDPSLPEKIIDWIKSLFAGSDSPPSPPPAEAEHLLSSFSALSDQLTEDAARIRLLCEHIPSLSSEDYPDYPDSLEDFGCGLSALTEHTASCPVYISDEVKRSIALAVRP